MKHKTANFIKAWIIPFCILACIAWFIFRFFTTEEQNTYYCENCKVWHNNDDKELEEIWCNNCETWHLPKDPSNNQIIK